MGLVALRGRMKVPDTVGDIMARPVVTVGPGSTLMEAMRSMREHNIGAVVVVDGGKVVGIVTERDIVRFLADNPSRCDASISEVMTRDVVVCSPDTPILRAFIVMYERRIRRLPVVSSEGELVGMVTMRDLLHWIVRLLKG
jgi:CBS domain-containing protein